MDLKRAIADVSQRFGTQYPSTLVGFVEEVYEDWTVSIGYLDPDKGTKNVLDDVPLPNSGGTSFRPAMPKRGDMVAFFFPKGNSTNAYILATYTVHNLDADNHALTMGDLLGGA